MNKFYIKKIVIFCAICLLILLFIIATFKFEKDERTTKKNITEEKYTSVNQYVSEIQGNQFKRTELQVKFIDSNSVDLKMKMKLSKHLFKIFKHTKNQPTFSFAANMNQDVLSKFVLKKSPEVVKVNFQLDSNQVMHIHQKLYLNAPISSKTKPLFLDTRNYQFLFLNERQQAVAILFDLNLSTWQ